MHNVLQLHAGAPPVEHVRSSEVQLALVAVGMTVCKALQ